MTTDKKMDEKDAEKFLKALSDVFDPLEKWLQDVWLTFCDVADKIEKILEEYHDN